MTVCGTNLNGSSVHFPNFCQFLSISHFSLTWNWIYFANEKRHLLTKYTVYMYICIYVYISIGNIYSTLLIIMIFHWWDLVPLNWSAQEFCYSRPEGWKVASWRQNHDIGFVVICGKCHEILILVLTFFLVPSEIRSTFDKKVGRRPTGRSEALRLNGWNSGWRRVVGWLCLGK